MSVFLFTFRKTLTTTIIFKSFTKMSEVRIPTQVATRFRFIAPPDSDLSRHPIPGEVATGFRSIPPPPGR